MALTTSDPRVERTRRVVLAATIDVIAERGFRGATVDAIASRSGVARSTIYRNWNDRNELLLNAVRSRFGALNDTIVGELRGDLVTLCTRLVRLLTVEPMASVAASLIVESRRDPALGDLHRRFAEGRMREIASVVEAATARGDLPPVADPIGFAVELGGPIFLRAMVLREAIDPAWIEAHVDAVLARTRTEA